MATHSSVLAWRIPGTGEPGGLPSMGSHRVGHDWSDLAAAAELRCCPLIDDFGFPGGSDGKESACNARDAGSFPGSGRSPGEGNGYPLQYLAWKISWTEEPGELKSMGSQRVGHNRANNTFTFHSAASRIKIHFFSYFSSFWWTGNGWVTQGESNWLM